MNEVGVFTTARAEGGQLWFAADHIARMQAGARALGLRVPRASELLAGAQSAVRSGVQAVGQPSPRARVRMLLPLTTGQVRFEAAPYEPPTRSWVLRPVAWSPHQDRPSYKSMRRRAYARARHEARPADDALLVHPLYGILETSIANVFLQVGGRWRTPPAHLPLLAGIARRRVLSALRRLGEPVDELPVSVRDVYEASGFLLTNAVMGVHAVRACEGWGGFPDPELARRLLQEMHAVPGERPGAV